MYTRAKAPHAIGSSLDAKIQSVLQPSVQTSDPPLCNYCMNNETRLHHFDHRADTGLILTFIRCWHIENIELIVLYGFRYQEDGVQDQAVAREMLLLRCMQEPDRNEELHPTRAGNLLCRMLRGQVCHPMRQVQ